MFMSLNPKTIELLTFLRQNSREKLTTISRKTHIPISTLFDLLKEMQKTLVKKNTVLVDFSQLGYHTIAHVFLKVHKEDKDKLKSFLQYNSQVNSLYKINSGWDFMIEIIHKNIKDSDRFLENINHNFNIEEKQIHYIVDELKREGFMEKVEIS